VLLYVYILLFMNFIIFVIYLLIKRKSNTIITLIRTIRIIIIILLTDNSDFNFGGIRSMLINCCDLISTAIFTFRFVVKEFAVVRHVLYSAMRSLLNTPIIDHPCNIWWWFADDLDIKVERFVFTHSYVA